MTEQEWKNRCARRILRAVKKAGRMRFRELRRATSYNRGPFNSGINLWFEALEELAQVKCIVLERDAEDAIRFVKTPEVSAQGCQHNK